jgi:hypothetical protein
MKNKYCLDNSRVLAHNNTLPIDSNNKQGNTSAVARTVIILTAGSHATATWEKTKLTLMPWWTTVVNVEVQCVGEGDIRVMILDLLFEGLWNLMDKDRDGCYLHPDDFTNQARRQIDMPTKFQCIHKKMVQI